MNKGTPLPIKKNRLIKPPTTSSKELTKSTNGLASCPITGTSSRLLIASSVLTISLIGWAMFANVCAGFGLGNRLIISNTGCIKIGIIICELIMRINCSNAASPIPGLYGIYFSFSSGSKSRYWSAVMMRDLRASSSFLVIAILVTFNKCV